MAKPQRQSEKQVAQSVAIASYSDGRPFDVVQYLQAKIILKPDRFTSAQSLRDFGGLVQRSARKVGIGFVTSPRAKGRPAIREIVFGDTSDYLLYNNAFILRRRTCYADGFPERDPQIVFKFRHPDARKAAAMDVRPNIAGKYHVKFKVEALPLRDAVGGYRFLYSHNCEFGLSQMHDADKTSMATLSRVFPALAALHLPGEARVSMVSETIVEEVLLELGQLSFVKGIEAKCGVALWRTRGEHQPLVGEFSYQVKFDRRKRLHKKARKMCEQFFITLQLDVKDWIALGTTKTGMVYRLKGNPPQSHE